LTATTSTPTPDTFSKDDFDLQSKIEDTKKKSDEQLQHDIDKFISSMRGENLSEVDDFDYGNARISIKNNYEDTAKTRSLLKSVANSSKPDLFFEKFRSSFDNDEDGDYDDDDDDDDEDDDNDDDNHSGGESLSDDQDDRIDIVNKNKSIIYHQLSSSKKEVAHSSMTSAQRTTAEVAVFSEEVEPVALNIKDKRSGNTQLKSHRGQKKELKTVRPSIESGHLRSMSSRVFDYLSEEGFDDDKYNHSSSDRYGWGLTGSTYAVTCRDVHCSSGGWCVLQDDSRAVACRCPLGTAGKLCEQGLYASRLLKRPRMTIYSFCF